MDSLPSSDGAGDRRVYEPSMEEILASIRRIIADDQTLPSGSAPLFPTHTAPVEVEPVAPAAEQENDTAAASAEQAGVDIDEPATPSEAPHSPSPEVFDLSAQVAPAPEESFEPAYEMDAVDENIRGTSFDADDAAAESRSTVDAAAHDVEAEKAPLFSAATDSTVSAAFKMLAASRLADNSDEIMTLARDMIRPLLRTWIDDNLPGMVERMVRAEIERVARGGR